MDFRTLEHFGVPVLPYSICSSVDSAQKAAARMGFPVALKLISSNFLHKSDSGALALNIADSGRLVKEYGRLAAMAKNSSDGYSILVQAFRPGNLELIIGGRIDPQFGPVILIGWGGIYTETMRDTALRVCPIDADEARAMIRSLRCYPILAGARGRKPIDESALVRILIGVSNLMMRIRPSELDINPLFVRDDGLWAADARIIR